jgi:hypothetical protein
MFKEYRAHPGPAGLTSTVIGQRAISLTANGNRYDYVLAIEVSAFD